MLALLLLVPLGGLMLLNLPFIRTLRKPALCFALLLSGAQMILVLWHPAGFWSAPGGLDRFVGFGLRVDAMSLVLLFCVGMVLFVTLQVAHGIAGGAMRDPLDFVNVLLIAMIGMNGAVMVTDLFSLYLFMEITSVASFILIAFDRAKDALEGAFKYLILSAVATILMLSSIGLLLLVGGATSFDGVRAALHAAAGGSVLAKVAVGLFACGLLIKGGLVPFHGWLPGAYSAAPPAISVLLAGITTKATGVYGLLRLVPMFAGDGSIWQVVLFVGAVSIVVGALAALGQTDMKWMLAYSSISQVGYIVLGLGTGTALGIAGAVFHLFNHAVFKSLLFVNSAAVEQRLGTTDMSRMGGLGSRMPVTGITSLVGSLSTAGIPPFAGFWSKLVIIIALWQARQFSYAVIAVLLSVVTLAYLLLMQRKVFFGKVPAGLSHVQEASFGLVIPAVLLATITTLVGVLFPLVAHAFALPPGLVPGH